MVSSSLKMSRRVHGLITSWSGTTVVGWICRGRCIFYQMNLELEPKQSGARCKGDGKSLSLKLNHTCNFLQSMIDETVKSSQKEGKEVSGSLAEIDSVHINFSRSIF